MSTTHRGRNTLITALAVIVMAAALGGLAAPGQPVAAAGPPSRVVVRPGESIQEAVDQAVTGSTILVRPGTYREQVRITTDGITLRGNHARIVPPVVTVAGTCQEPGATAICVIGDVDETGTVLDPVRAVSVTGFTVSGFTGTGLYAYGGDGITVSRNRFVDNGGYGTFARRSTGITITDNLASRNVSAGIYVGINPDAKLLIAGNRSTENREGLLLLDTVGGTIVDNDFSDNCVGALLASSGAPGVAPSADLDVIGNRVNDSNRACGPIGEVIPPLSGAGIVLAGTSDVLVFDNTVRRSVSTGPTAVRSGISVVAAFGGPAGTGNRIIGNRMADNVPVDLEVAAGGDVAVAANRCGTADIDGACKATVIPPALPGATEPTPADAAPTTSVSSSPATSEEATP